MIPVATILSLLIMPTVLLNKKPPPLKQNIYQNQSKSQKNGVAHGGVVQDSRGVPRVRVEFDEPVTVSDPARTPLSNTETPRTKKHSTKRRLTQLATWVENPIVLQVKDFARSYTPFPVSVSTAIRDLLTEILQLKFEKRQAAQLPTIIMKAVYKAVRALSNRLVYFDIRNSIAAEQTRILTIDLYKRQLAKDGVPAGKIQEKIDQSSQMARKNVLTMTPQLKKLIAEWEALFPLEEIDQASPRQGRGGEGKGA
jgi:hypothetical protein